MTTETRAQNLNLIVPVFWTFVLVFVSRDFELGRKFWSEDSTIVPRVAIPPIATHFVRLSVVCHIRAPCLNRLTDLDAIWQVPLRGTMTPWGS